MSFPLKHELEPSARFGCERARVGTQEAVDGEGGIGLGMSPGCEAEDKRPGVRHMEDRQELKAVV